MNTELKGINLETVKKISEIKKEPEWMRQFRINSYEEFIKKENPTFGPNLNINFDDITYYKKVGEIKNNWEEVPKKVKETFDKLGIPDAEKKYLAGIGAQYESEVIYHNMLEEVKEKNVIFTSIEDACKKYPDLVKKYFGTIVKNNENKFAALNSSVFRGGSFIYIPPNTTLDRPLHSYF